MSVRNRGPSNLFGGQHISNNYPDTKVHGANMGLIWGRQDPGELHIGPMNFAIWVELTSLSTIAGRAIQSVSLVVYRPYMKVDGVQ